MADTAIGLAIVIVIMILLAYALKDERGDD